MNREVQFSSEGHRVSGVLVVPQQVPGRVLPALVLCPDLALVQSVGLPVLAERLADAGYATLRIDYRGWGASAGEPRGQIDPSQQVEDVRSALSWLASQPEVDSDRLALWGAGLGGGVALEVAALDQRVRGAVAVCPLGDGARWLRGARRAEAWRRWRSWLTQERINRARHGFAEYVPALGADDQALLPTSANYLGWLESLASDERALRRHVPLRSAEALLRFRPEGMLDLLEDRRVAILGSPDDTLFPLEEAVLCARAAWPAGELHVMPRGLIVDHQGLWQGQARDWVLAHSARCLEAWLGGDQTQQAAEAAATGEVAQDAVLQSAQEAAPEPDSTGDPARGEVAEAELVDGATTPAIARGVEAESQDLTQTETLGQSAPPAAEATQATEAATVEAELTGGDMAPAEVALASAAQEPATGQVVETSAEALPSAQGETLSAQPAEVAAMREPSLTQTETVGQSAPPAEEATQATEAATAEMEQTGGDMAPAGVVAESVTHLQEPEVVQGAETSAESLSEVTQGLPPAIEARTAVPIDSTADQGPVLINEEAATLLDQGVADAASAAVPPRDQTPVTDGVTAEEVPAGEEGTARAVPESDAATLSQAPAGEQEKALPRDGESQVGLSPQGAEPLDPATSSTAPATVGAGAPAEETIPEPKA